MKELSEITQLVSNYRGTENDYRVLAEAEEAKLPALRARIRERLRAVRP